MAESMRFCRHQHLRLEMADQDVTSEFIRIHASQSLIKIRHHYVVNAELVEQLQALIFDSETYPPLLCRRENLLRNRFECKDSGLQTTAGRLTTRASNQELVADVHAIKAAHNHPAVSAFKFGLQASGDSHCAQIPSTARHLRRSCCSTLRQLTLG